jgi:heme exporter protein A
MTEGARLLERRDLDLTRGDRRLVAGLSLDLDVGQLALVTGANGSGKTTLLRTLAGLAPPAAGRVLFQSRPVASLGVEERARIQYLGHLDGLKKDLTIRENIQCINEIRSNHNSIHKVLAEVGLEPYADRPVRQLSAGQKRRAALAALRLGAARLWILDEPLTNLDSEGRALVTRWIDEHLAAAGSAVVATHLAAGLERPGALLVEL